jgi:thiol-disulfide isomerase/thioredoxin
MKMLKFLPVLFLCNAAAAQDGYEVKVTLKPFKNQYVYLGHYFGKQLPVIDSVKLDDKSTAVFKGPKKLPGGIYLLGYPDKTGYFELIIDKEQRFAVQADTVSKYKGLKFQNSKENLAFNTYQLLSQENGLRADSAKKALAGIKTKKDSTKLNDIIANAGKAVRTFREDFLKKNNDAVLSLIFKLTNEPTVPPAAMHPGGKYDSLYAYQYFKNHYWDGIYLFDERLARTPGNLFETKLDRYFEQLVVPNADSVIKELDYFLSYSSVSADLQKFLLIKFANRYMQMKYQSDDAVFVHLYQKYFANKTYPWLTEKGSKTIIDRAYSMMSNITGTPSPEINLPDTAGKDVSLYAVPAPYTVVVIYDPTCGHCKETLPSVDSIYTKKWKAAGVKIFAMAKETGGNKKNWTDFIAEHKLQGWYNVYCSKKTEEERVKSNIPSYSQLFDVLTFPTLYLLDKDKKIIAKKLTYLQIDEVMNYKMKGQ